MPRRDAETYSRFRGVGGAVHTDAIFPTLKFEGAIKILASQGSNFNRQGRIPKIEGDPPFTAGNPNERVFA